jgi:hypothetical protein
VTHKKTERGGAIMTALWLADSTIPSRRTKKCCSSLRFDTTETTDFEKTRYGLVGLLKLVRRAQELPSKLGIPTKSLYPGQR